LSPLEFCDFLSGIFWFDPKGDDVPVPTVAPAVTLFPCLAPCLRLRRHEKWTDRCLRTTGRGEDKLRLRTLPSPSLVPTR
jgi:hypothetical protein